MSYKTAYSTISGKEVKAHQDQIDKSIYYLPANSTYEKPPSYDAENQIIQFENNKWEVLPKPEPEKPELSALPDPMETLRMIRDSKLAQSDWRMVTDYPNSDQEAWKIYRQALRDLPSNVTPEWNQETRELIVDYPEEPSQ